MRIREVILIFILLVFNGCQQKTIKRSSIIVSSSDSIHYNKIKKMNLDSAYSDLLNRKNLIDSERTIVYKAWSEFHKKLSKYVKQVKFDWEVPDSTITIFNRVYFDKNGYVDYYKFKIKNSSISTKKIKEYEKILQKFCKKEKLDIERPEKFAQCGTIIFQNYKENEH